MSDPYAALRVPDFRRYIVFLAAQTLATMMQGVAVGWQLYQVTHDPLALGLIGLAEALPFIAFALPAGHLADRVDRRRLSLMGLIVLASCSAALFAFTELGLVRSDTAWLVYGVIFVSGIARSYLQPARTALRRPRAAAAYPLNSITWRSSTAIRGGQGPALGGLLLAAADPSLTHGVAAVLLIGAWVACSGSRRIHRPCRWGPKFTGLLGACGSS
jgi:MFS family permease